jgi:hypothetical protein
VRVSKSAQPAAKPSPTPTVKTSAKPTVKTSAKPTVKTSAKPTVKSTPKPNPTTAFDKDYNARFRNGTYDSGDYKDAPVKKK